MFPDVGTSQLLTAQDVERISLPGKVTELVRGQLVVREPPGTRHGAIAANLAYHLNDFVRRRELGTVFAQDTGFKIASDPDTVRAPDVAFLGGERAGAIPTRGYAEVAPDLLAEILSPDDRQPRSWPRSPTGSELARSWCGSWILRGPRCESTARTGVSPS